MCALYTQELNLEFAIPLWNFLTRSESDKESWSRLIMDFFQVRCREFIEGVRSTEVNVPNLQSHCSHRSEVPNDQLPIDSGRADLGDRPALPFVRSHTRDSVLVGREQLRFPLRASISTTRARETPGIRVFERIEGCAVQSPGSNRTELGRVDSGFLGGRVVETSNEPPFIFVSREDVRLAIMTSSDDGVIGGPNKGDERKSGHPDGPDPG